MEFSRRFARSFLDVTILHMLAYEPLWGYKMMAMLRERYDTKVGPSVIYPLLDSMEADGLVEAKEVYEGRRRRKMYSATEKGLGYVKCLKNILSEMVR